MPTPEDVADVLKRSEGIPLYVAELAQLPAAEVRSAGGLAADHLLRGRFATLSGEARSAIGVAGVFGARFDLASLQAVGRERIPTIRAGSKKR